MTEQEMLEQINSLRIECEIVRQKPEYRQKQYDLFLLLREISKFKSMIGLLKSNNPNSLTQIQKFEEKQKFEDCRQFVQNVMNKENSTNILKVKKNRVAVSNLKKIVLYGKVKKQRKVCRRKVTFLTKTAAEKRAFSITKEDKIFKVTNKKLAVYRCPICRLYHLTGENNRKQ